LVEAWCGGAVVVIKLLATVTFLERMPSMTPFEVAVIFLQGPGAKNTWTMA
jgi:hypothetical protein